MTEFPKPAEYLQRARALEASSVHGGVTRLAVLGSFTAEFLRPSLIVECDALGVRLDPWFGPFGAFEQQVLDPSSALWSAPREAIALLLRIEDVDPELAREHPQVGAAAAAARLAKIRERLVSLARAIRERSGAYILAANFGCPRPLDVFDASDPDGLVHLVAAENRELARELARVPGAHVFDWSGVLGEWGTPRATDPKLWYLARVALAAEVQPAVARRFARCLRAILAPAAKCVVVDLDNTLWGGVLGDDGPEGIQLGDAHPGNSFKDVQRLLGELRRRGFLLAISSKNDEARVLDTLAHHPEMVLRPGDFAAIFANWEPKAASLRRIAEALHIGLDALVFLDDNPVERAQVRAELPMVHVVELPSDPLRVPAALAEIALLDRPRLLDDDRARATMVAADAHRRQPVQSGETVSEFLAGLGMMATVGATDAMTLDRVHQLIHKTNQFNLTTRRHSMDEVARLARSPESAVVWLRLRDRFGDLGLVCVGIVRHVEGELWEVDTLLMSCRVMGRQVEHAFLHHLLSVAAKAGARRVRGVYRRSAKNGIVADLYPQLGLAEVSRTPDEAIYEIDVERALPAWPDFIGRAAGGETR